MANVATITPLNQFFDTNGSPLNSGYLFFGEPNQDPEQFPVQMFWDAAGTIPALQPIRTISGYPSRAGSPAIIYGPDSYSLRVKNSASVQVLYAPELGGLSSSASLAASSGSTLVGFIQAGVGAVARTAQSKMRDIICVKDFGAVGDGIADDTIAIQTAINDHPTSALYFPRGTYLFSTLSVPTGMSFLGASRSSTILRTTSATADAIVCTSTLAVEFSNMTIGATVTRTAGSYIKIAPAASYNGSSIFLNLSFQAGYDNINFSAAATWAVQNCIFQSFTNIAIIVRNTATPDAGDSVITGSTFNGASGSIHVNQYSSGGLRITNNKFLNGAYHYLSGFDTGASASSILIIHSNSSEAATVANIALNSTANTAFSKVLIQDNQISVNANATGIAMQDPGYVWLDDVSVGGNNIAMGGAGGVAINIARANRLTVTTNQIVGNNLETGFIIGANVTNAVISPQDITSIATPWSGTFTNIIFSPGRKEVGDVTAAAASTVYGPLFAGATGTVNFTQAYAKAPSVICNALATGGGVSILISNVTTTSFQYNVLTVTNGGVVQFKWQANG